MVNISSALMIKDKKVLLNLRAKGVEKFPGCWGFPGGKNDDGETPEEAVVREVKEETGIDVEFDSIISLGHFYPHQFHKSNLYILCIANAKSSEINIEDTKEILEAKWMDVNEYIEDESVLSYSKAVVISAIEYKGFKLANQETLCHIKKDFELFFPVENK